MLPPENTQPPSDASPPEGLVEAGVYATETEAYEHGLVVLALGHPYWLIPYEGGFRLLVEPDSLEASQRHLTLYARERRRWPPALLVPADVRVPASVIPPLLWVLVTIGAFRAQELWPDPLETGGLLDSEKVFQHGQVWRIATALFLHADIAHLTANLVSGFFVFSAVLTGVGRVRGAVILILASLAGNAAVVSLHAADPYRSLGASTAVFAGLGILTGAALRRVMRSSGPTQWRLLFPPLAAGLTLLGLFGAGELHTDVAAHACGFAAGLCGGIVVGFRRALGPVTR